MGLIDKFNSMVFEGGPPQPAKPTPVSTVSPSPLSVRSSYISVSNGSEDPNLVQQITETLRLKTQPSSNSVLAQVEAASAKLANIIPDKSTRYKATIAQMFPSVESGISAVLSAFDSQLSQLEVEKNQFDTSMTQSSNQISALKTQIDDTDRKIEELQVQRERIKSSIESQTLKQKTVSASFTRAYDARKEELQQLKDNLSNSLK